MNLLKIGIGTLFGAGLLPKAPGTWGSFLTLPLIYITALYFSTAGLIVFVLAACALSLWTAGANINKFGQDPPQFVMDECAGQAVVFLCTGFSSASSSELLILFTGFILFRLFDILKPLGIDRLQKFPGKFGILFDDLLAGFYGLICLELLKYLPAVIF